MYESFFAAVRTVVPMALLMLAGFLARKSKIIDSPSMRKYDKLIFALFMPTLLFKNIYEADFSGGTDFSKAFIFAGVSLVVIFLFSIFFIPKFIKDHNKAAVIAQATVRCNYILFGIAVSEALYGEGKAGTVAILGTLVVPAINILSAIILELNRSGKANPLKLFIAVLKNPMIIGAILAFIFKGFNIYIPVPIWMALKGIANATTTVSFISLGIGLDMAETRSDFKPLLFAIVLRMIFVPVIFMSLSLLLGFKGSMLCALMVIFASPTAVASYPMAVAMGADGNLAGQIVCVTTLLSVFTLFLWTFGLMNFGML